MGNVNLPAPVLVVGALLCLFSGYMLGVFLGPEAPDRTSGVVESYDPSSHELCLTGDAVEELDGASDGRLCGTWQKAQGSQRPRPGDDFRFVSRLVPAADEDDEDRVVIFGEVED